MWLCLVGSGSKMTSVVALYVLGSKKIGDENAKRRLTGGHRGTPNSPINLGSDLHLGNCRRPSTRQVGILGGLWPLFFSSQASFPKLCFILSWVIWPHIHRRLSAFGGCKGIKEPNKETEGSFSHAFVPGSVQGPCSLSNPWGRASHQSRGDYAASKSVHSA